MSNTNLNRNQGFSLIEVMIAVLVLSFGLLALTALQAGLFRAGAEAKARSNATALAQNAIENARSFAYVTRASYDGPTYLGLANASLGTQAVGGVSYSVEQTVQRRCWTGTAFGTCDPLAYDAARPEYKNVGVAVSWIADDGTSKVIELEDSVAAVAPADSIQVVKTPPKNLGGPQVWIEPPNKDNPAVVPIAVGDDRSAASSNPVPRRFSKVDDNTAATLFSVLTFTGSSAGSEVLLNRKLDVAGATCRCSTGGGAAYKSTPTNPAYQPTVWNGAQLAYMDPQPLAAGTKIGLFEDTGTSAKDIAAMCDTCCRDHHESASRKQRPDPHRALAAAEQGGAEHYFFSNLSTPISSGIYSEACQLIRVGGRMRISVDPVQNMLVSVPLNAAETGHEPSNFVERFSALVVAYLQDAANALPTGYLSPGAPLKEFNPSAYSCRGTGDTQCDPGYSDILDPAAIYLGPAPDFKKLVSFGLYVDFITSDTKKAFDCALSKSTAAQCDGLRDRNPLETLPFYAINVANLGVWDENSKGAEWLTVSSPQFASNTGILAGEGGVVTRLAGRKPEAANKDCGFIDFNISRSSSGLAGRLPIDPDDQRAPKARNKIAFKSERTTLSCESVLLPLPLP